MTDDELDRVDRARPQALAVADAHLRTDQARLPVDHREDVLLGAHLDAGARADAPVERDERVQCRREGAALHRVGTLPEPRAGFTTMPVAGAFGRYLVVGGLDLVGGASPADPLLLDLNGCTCGVAGMRTLTLPPSQTLSFHAAAMLADDSILIVGGLLFDLARGVSVATPQSLLFVPDLEPD